MDLEKRNRIEPLLQAFNNIARIGIPTDKGLHLDDLHIRDTNETLYRKGIYFTQRQVIDAHKNGGVLFIKDNNQEGIAELEFINRGIVFHKVNPSVFRIRLYKKEIKEFYDVIQDIRQELHNFDHVKMRKNDIFSFLRKHALTHNTTQLRMELREDKEHGWYMLARDEKKVIEVIPIESLYDLYQANYVLKQKYGVDDFLYQYPLALGQDDKTAMEFYNAITNYIINNE